MLEEHPELFSELTEAHTALQADSSKQESFDEVRRKAIRIISKYEDQLCSKTERTKFANFSTSLSEKFWELIRINYPFL